MKTDLSCATQFVDLVSVTLVKPCRASQVDIPEEVELVAKALSTLSSSCVAMLEFGKVAGDVENSADTAVTPDFLKLLQRVMATKVEMKNLVQNNLLPALLLGVAHREAPALQAAQNAAFCAGNYTDLVVARCTDAWCPKVIEKHV